MFQGWLSFGGTEILNEERFRAYQKELVPGVSMPTVCSDEKNLAATLADAPYRTPMMDEAPWVDHDDPDTYGFVGAFPLTVSGLTDSTRTASVVENTVDGGAVVGRRRATKEVRVTALLMGDTEAALSAGKRWLAAALDGGCDPCEPSDLCFLVGTNPDGVTMGDYVGYLIEPKDIYGPAEVWSPGTGTFTPTSSGQSLISPPSHVPLPCDEIFWHWRITSATAGTQIVLETVSETGVTVSTPYTLSATGGTFTVTDRGIAQKSSYSRLRVTSAPGETVVIGDVTMEYRAEPTEDACFRKYARQLRRVTCISGPVTIEEYQPTHGAMEKVEFAFTAETPYIFGLQQEVLTMIGGKYLSRTSSGAPLITNTKTADYRLTNTLPMCEPGGNKPKPYTDPHCPPIPLPPRTNVSTTACDPADPYKIGYALPIPDALIPTWSDVVPIFSLTAGGYGARDVRVRFLPRPLPTQSAEDLDPCSACGSFVIDYIPPHAKFTVDAAEERAYITHSNIQTTANHLLSGVTSGSLFEWPVLTCGTGYFVILDLPENRITKFSIDLATRE